MRVADDGLIQRLIEEAVTADNLEVLDEVATGEFAQTARRWAGPFRAPFPTSRWRSSTLSPTARKWPRISGAPGPAWGEWMGHPPTGRRFQDVDEIYIFRVADGKLGGAFGVEDHMRRMRWPNKVALVAHALEHRARAVPGFPIQAACRGYAGVPDRAAALAW